MPRTFVLTATLAAILALHAAACTSGEPTEATPPLEATTPAPTSTPRPTSTPERTPTPEPTPEVQWDEHGLPLGIEGPLIVLRQSGGKVAVVTPAGQTLWLFDPRGSVSIAGRRLLVAHGGAFEVINLDGTPAPVQVEPTGWVHSVSASTDGRYLAWVDGARPRNDSPVVEGLTLSLLDTLTGGHVEIRQEELPIHTTLGLRVTHWLDTGGSFALLGVRNQEAAGDVAFVSPRGIVTAGPTAFLWFSQPGGHYAYAVEGEGCLLINGAEIVAEAVGGAEVFRIVGNDDERLTPSAISPDGTEVLFESRRFDPDDTDCAWAESAPDLYLATAGGERTPVNDPRPIFERWGVLPPFEVECIEIGYRFCPASETVEYGRAGLMAYGDVRGAADHVTVFLGVVDLPPP